MCVFSKEEIKYPFLSKKTKLKRWLTLSWRKRRKYITTAASSNIIWLLVVLSPYFSSFDNTTFSLLLCIYFIWHGGAINEKWNIYYKYIVVWYSGRGTSAPTASHKSNRELSLQCTHYCFQKVSTKSKHEAFSFLSTSSLLCTIFLPFHSSTPP